MKYMIIVNTKNINNHKSKIFYRNIEGILNKNIIYEYTDDEIKQINFYKNKINFIEYLLNRILTNEEVLFINSLNDNRRCLFKNYDKELLNLYILYTLIYTNRTFMFFGKNTLNNISMIKEYYLKLPYYLKPSVIKWCKDTIQLNNGNYIVYCNDRIYNNCNNYLIDIEEYTNKKEIYNNIFPVINSIKDTKSIIITSTPIGNNVYYEEYLKHV